MIKNADAKKEKLIKGSRYPLLARLAVVFMTRIEEEKRLPEFVRMDTCIKRGVSSRKIQPVIDNTIEEVMYSVVGDTYETLPEKALQQQMKTYLVSVRD